MQTYIHTPLSRETNTKDYQQNSFLHTPVDAQKSAARPNQRNI